MALIDKFRKGLSKSRINFTTKLTTAFKRHPKLDNLFWENLEEILIAADVGFDTTIKIIDTLKAEVKKQKLKESEEIRLLLIENLSEIFRTQEPEILKKDKQIIIVMGVNGTGKTTTIAKMASLIKSKGEKVVLAAADTFRAAAIEQLEQWAKRMDVRLVKHERGSDPAAVIYDSIKAAKARNYNYVIADTAGRLHTQENLMEELKKIKRVAVKKAGEYSVKSLLVLDGNTGQNALVQTELFNQSLGVDEIALTKMDSTAKGGIAIAIADKFGIPVSYMGLGEKINDLQLFDPKSYARSLIED